MTTLTVDASWKPRSEDEETVAARLAAFVPHLRAFHPTYAELTRGRDRPRQPLIPMPDIAAEFATEMRQGRIRNDTDRAIMPGAGFSCLWDDNTRRFEQARLGISAASHLRRGSVSVEVPEEVVSEITLTSVRQLLTALVELFEPDSASANESGAILTGNERNEFIYRVGWLLYLRDGPPIPAIDGVEVSPLGPGPLYVIDEPTFDPASARYQQRAKALYHALLAAGADVGEPSVTA